MAIVRRTVETNSATLVCQIIGIILIVRNAGGLWFSEFGGVFEKSRTEL